MWFISLLNEEDGETLRNLSDEAKCFLKILRNSETNEAFGVISASDALRILNEKGYDLRLIPHIPDRVDEYFKTVDGEFTQFYYLIPEDMKSEEYKAGLRELDEKNRRRLDRRGY